MKFGCPPISVWVSSSFFLKTCILGFVSGRCPRQNALMKIWSLLLRRGWARCRGRNFTVTNSFFFSFFFFFLLNEILHTILCFCILLAGEKANLIATVMIYVPNRRVGVSFVHSVIQSRHKQQNNKKNVREFNLFDFYCSIGLLIWSNILIKLLPEIIWRFFSSKLVRCLLHVLFWRR